MGISERRARDREMLRGKILDAAGQLFVREGVASVSLRKIADKIEYSPATIYLYFRDKNELFTSLCQETFVPLKAELERLEQEVSDPLQALRDGLRFYIEFGLEHPHHYVLTFCTPKREFKDLENAPNFQETNQTGLETFDCLRRSLVRCRDRGLLEFGDLEATSQSVWMSIHGTTSLLISAHGNPHFPWVEKETLIRTSIDLVMRGLRKEC
ncbi:MAG: TetR/AcrR family transcriptional regulator [Candidatus Solibacter usitatus]|nr:TetR/AcrR family transcriptional regulator [Candidatus Solibacter usitatus]